MSNNYGFNEMNRDSHLRGIQNSVDGVQRAINDQTYLQAYGVEAYTKMIEKRKFRHQVIWCGFGAFLVGFFGVGLYLCNWNMNELFSRLANFFTNLF